MLARLFKGLLPNPLKKSKQEQASADPLAEARCHIDEKRFDLAREIVDVRLAADAADAQGWSLRGEIRYWEKDDAGAIECFEKALRLRPELERAHYGLSLAYHELGEAEKARLHAQYALGRDRINAAYLAHAGLCELTLGNSVKALELFRRSVQYDASSAMTWNNLGIAHLNVGFLDKAQADFSRAVELDPGLEIAHRNLTKLYGEMGDTEKAEAHERVANTLASQYADGRPAVKLDNRPVESLSDPFGGVAAEINGVLETIDRLANTGESTKAIALAEQIVADNPGETSAVVKLCELLQDRASWEEALDVIEVALVHNPEDPRLLTAKGGICERLCRYQEAALLLERADELDPDNVNTLDTLGQAYFNLEDFARAERVASRLHAIRNTLASRLKLATAQVNACRYDDALENFEIAMGEHPELKGNPQIARNVGVCLLYLGRTEGALEQLNVAIAAEPDNASSRFSRALVNLLLDRYEQGWEDYCYRFYSQIADTRLLPFPLWNGQPLEGRRILILAEQGLGDQLMFASCFQDLLRLDPSTVHIEAHRRLEKVLGRSFPSCQVIGTDQDHQFGWVKDIGEPDFYMHAGDLARHFRQSVQAFPRHDGYLRADPARVEYWQQRLQALGSGPKIGLSWRGGTQKTRQVVRSLELANLAPLLRHPGVHFISLQYGDVAEEVRAAETALGISLPHWPEGIADLDEFAALIRALDLVISVCNTTVHFSGALGKPVWVMAPAVPEWRYGLDAPSMHWYPSSVMFRPSHHGAWDTVIRNIRDTLTRRFCG